MALLNSPTPVAAAFLLQRTELPAFYVWALAIAVLLATAILLTRRPRPRSLRLGFLTFSLAWMLGITTLAITRFDLALLLCQEDHLAEWLSCDFLLAAWVAGLILTIRLGRGKQPSPMTALLTAGFFWGFWRELEWGRPFFGQKIWYSRNLFNPQAYISPEYMEQFNRSLNHLESRPLFVMQWICSLAVFASVALLAVYLIRHRKVFRNELRHCVRTLQGKFFMLGCGIYIGSQLAGRSLTWVITGDFNNPYYGPIRLSHRIIDEPLEALAALCFLLAIVAVWRATDSGVNKA